MYEVLGMEIMPLVCVENKCINLNCDYIRDGNEASVMLEKVS